MTQKLNLQLLEDVDILFKQRSIDEIVQIEKSLDYEIENKRVDLRSMVGDRYKDVLTASDAIKSMKSLSETIVNNIETINERSEKLVENTNCDIRKATLTTQSESNQDFVFAIQIRLTMAINEQIWVAIDKEDYSKAAQLYLLGQHIHTGLRLLKDDVLERMPILKRIKATIESLRARILTKINEKLKAVDINTQETSKNLTALMLLENNTSLELYKYFLDNRISALKSVVDANHSNVRNKISAMVQCLITSVNLMHDCFLCYNGQEKGLIWQELDFIVSEDSPKTYSKLELPKTPLIKYVSDIIKQFRPKCGMKNYELSQEKTEKLSKEWLNATSTIINEGLEDSLNLVTTIKGLNLIREEASKVFVPKNWSEICQKAKLPGNFEVWSFFFQKRVTQRAKELITKKNNVILEDLQKELAKNNDNLILTLNNWGEDNNDISRVENKHIGLSMKTKGFSQQIVNISNSFDGKFKDLLGDLCLYMYGSELDQVNFLIKTDNNKKFVDRNELELHLISNCEVNALKLTKYLMETLKGSGENVNFVQKSLFFARFLHALTVLCENYKKCCTCNGNLDVWDKVCANYNKIALQFWLNCVEDSVLKTNKILEDAFCGLGIFNSINMLPKWDLIEIQEQTEERVFKSQIKVPSSCSVILQNVLQNLNDNVNSVLPHTMPKSVHLQFIEKNVLAILNGYGSFTSQEFNQTLALQFLFDIKFISTFTIPRENINLVQKSQELSESFRSKIDPFDLDVFYKYLQNNVKQHALQNQMLLGCLLPTSGQLINLGTIEKNKEHEKEPSVMPLSVPATTTWFPLLPVTAPVQKTLAQNSSSSSKDANKANTQASRSSQNKKASRSGTAASLFGAMATDWFS